MSKYSIACSLAGALVLTASVAAQTQNPTTQPATPRNPPSTQTTPEPERPQASAANPARMVTVEGCLMREADVPGRQPNIAERAGLGEDFILTATKMVKGTAPAQSTTARARQPETAVGTSGTQGAMYEVDGIDDSQLKAHVGQRVQIDGTFEDLDNATARAGDDDLVDIRGTAIRQVAGSCTGAR